MQIVKERDLIGAQLVRRNDEVSLLYEKIKILDMTLHKAEGQYKERLGDLRILKLEIQNLRCRINILEKSNSAVGDLRYGKHIIQDVRSCMHRLRYVINGDCWNFDPPVTVKLCSEYSVAKFCTEFCTSRPLSKPILIVVGLTTYNLLGC